MQKTALEIKALARQVHCNEVNKEAADSMTFTLFALRHFPKSRSGWRNGTKHSLS
jgi:hypothetical protein